MEAKAMIKTLRAIMGKEPDDSVNDLLANEAIAAFLQNVPGVAFVKDLAGRYLYMNRLFLDAFDLGDQQWRGKTDRELFGAPRSDLCCASDAEVLRKRETVHTVESVPQRDGTHHYFISKFPLNDRHGEFAFLAGIGIDVTEHRRAEEALRASEARFDLGQRAAKMASWDWNISTGEISTSSYAGHLYGFGDEPFKPTFAQWLGFIHQADRQRVHDALDNALANAQEYDIEFRVVWPDLSVHWLSCRGRVIYDKNGQPLHMLGICLDVSERERAIEALHASERRFRALVEKSWDMVALLENTGHVLYASPGSIRVLGYEQSELVGRSFFDFVHPDDRQGVACLYADLTGQAEQSVAAHFRFQHKNGSWRWIEATETNQLGNPAVHAIIINMRDITRAKEAEAELRAAKDAAEAANRSKSEFLANMSHEIRTPLGAILGFAELMAAPELSGEERQAHLETIRRNGQALSRLIDDILDLTKVEAGRFEVERLEVDVPALARDVADLFRPQAEDKGLSLEVRVDAQAPRLIQSDPVRLRQILANLVGNAVKFTEAGKIRVRVSAGFEPGGLAISVEDTGPGIAPEKAGKLFQPFVQADSSTTRRFGGTGLGLALAKRMAHALGGELRLLRSIPGQGSAFCLSLKAPQAKSFIKTAPTRETPAGLPPKESPLEDVDVLLVEDGPDNQVLLSHFLRAAGARVDIAENGVEGIERATAKTYDAVLMDIQMPGIDGYETTQRLRHEGYGRPIIALTAHAMKGERERCLKAGCDDYLTKPVNRAKLIEMVAAYAEGQGDQPKAGIRDSRRTTFQDVSRPS